MASDEVIETDGNNDDLLREFFDFGDDLIMPDKPFDIKKESNDFHNTDFDANFGSPSGSSDFFLGATPSPSSSSSSSSVSGNVQTMPTTGSNHSLEFAMSIANDFMNIDFSDAAADVDIGNFDDELDIMSGYPEVLDSNIKTSKTEAHIKAKMSRDKTSKEQKQLPAAVLTRENVQVYTDLNSPLTLLRSKLEKRFNINLTSYSIWLQDKIPLDDESTLSEQCVEGTGVVKVQLNIQPHNDDGHRKINIVDVLKVEPEISTVENRRTSLANDDLSSDNFDEDEDDDFFNEDEDVEIEDVAPDSTVDHPVSNFVESVEFCQLRKRFKYPNSVSEWTRMHTVHWAKWVNRTFKGVRLNEENWNLDGRDFSAMSEDEFSLLVGNDPGNLLWSHFSLLRQTGMATVPSNTVTAQATTTMSNSSSKNVNGVKRTFDSISSSAVVRTAAAVPMLAKKQRVILGKYEEGKVFINNDDSSNVHRTGNNGNNVQLWKFLLDILTDYKHRNIIRWSLGDNCLDGEFIMSEPEGVARLWGQQKGKCTMNYEKLSRALRYYKGGNILDKVHNKKFTYRFVCDLRDIVGFSAKELDLRVREHVERASAAVEFV